MLFDIDIPKEARWIAQDADGEWWWYDTKPKLERGNDENWVCRTDYTDYGHIAYGFPPDDWKTERYKLEWI